MSTLSSANVTDVNRVLKECIHKMQIKIKYFMHQYYNSYAYFREPAHTRNARDWDVFSVSTFVNGPASMLTVLDTRFGSTAPNTLEPNLSAAGTVAVINKPPAVSVYTCTQWTVKTWHFIFDYNFG